MAVNQQGFPGYLRVAVGVVRDGQGRILIAHRQAHRHQGGLWEFPGGKIETDEETLAALSRELQEELGITLTHARPLIRIPHEYADRKVLLDVWLVDAFSGEAHGREGQSIRWVEPSALGEYAFPQANLPIITAARLPDEYLITPAPADVGGREAFLQQLSACLQGGARLLQLRVKNYPLQDYRQLAGAVVELCRPYRAICLLNGHPELVEGLGAGGCHLTGQQLWEIPTRPLPAHLWVGASCHNISDLERAEAIGVDFVVLSPVKATRTHPEAKPIGWDGLQALTERARVPVFALGGMAIADKALAWRSGAQGIAAIRGLWRRCA